VKFNKAAVIAEFDKELVAVDPAKNKNGVVPQWICNSMALVTAALKNGETLEDVPEDIMAKITFFGQWIETERYFTENYIQEARDILVRESVLDLVFREMKKNVEEGRIALKSELDAEED
jgi:hypothetical protein